MYVLGIVNSRRLGRSLGLDIIGADGTKRCNMNCVYCEVGNGKYKGEKGVYADFSVATSELLEWQDKEIDCVTFSGNGEPTLNSELKRYIDFIHEKFKKPVCVITNSSLLNDADVFNTLLKADIVIPSIDSLIEESFNKVDRPYKLDVNLIKDSIIRFSNKYKGRLYLESLIVKGYNDSKEDLESLYEFLKDVKYTEFHINTIDRIPAENVERFSSSEKEEILNYFVSKGVENIKLF